MKHLVTITIGVFALLLVFSIYISSRHYEGLVEEGYYEKAKGFFKLKQKEQRLGLTISRQALRRGNQKYVITLTTRNGPLSGATVELIIGRVSDKKTDRRWPMKEETAGTYSSTIQINETGLYLVRLQISSNTITTTRWWLERIH